MDRRRAAKQPASQSSGWHAAADDSELGDEELDVFTAERYFNDALAGEDALWCDRSSSSYSSAYKTWQHDESALAPTAATSSSEASWNSRSALLSNLPALAAAPATEGKPNSTAESEPAGGKTRSSSSHLRRWILGMAGCACRSSGIEESTSADDLYREEMDASSVDGGKKRSGEADGTLPGGASKQTAVDDGTTVRMMSRKWVEDGRPPPPLLLAERAHRRAANPGEMPVRIVDPGAHALYDERRRDSLDMFHQAGQGRTLVPAEQSSTFTIVAGSTARGGASGAAGGGSGSPDRPIGRAESPLDDAAAPSEVEYMYPPSEASIVWSVVTAEGAASGNFSSAASGCYHYFNDCDEEAIRHTAAGGRSSRRGRNNGGGLLMGCMSKRAVDTVGRPRTWSEVEPAPVARVSGPDVTLTRRR
jgi:hypothetical protein